MAIRNGTPNRASVVSCLKDDPTSSLITTIPRGTYEAFERMAREHGFTKAAYLRKLVIEHVDAKAETPVSR